MVEESAFTRAAPEMMPPENVWTLREGTGTLSRGQGGHSSREKGIPHNLPNASVSFKGIK